MVSGDQSRSRVIKGISIGVGALLIPMLAYNILSGVLPESRESSVSQETAPQETAPQEITLNKSATSSSTDRADALASVAGLAVRSTPIRKGETAKFESQSGVGVTTPSLLQPGSARPQDFETQLPARNYIFAEGMAETQQAEAIATTEGGAAAESLQEFLKQEVLTVASGDTLMGLLTKMGIERREAYEAIEVLSDVFSPRKLRIGQEIQLAVADEGEAIRLMSLQLRPDIETDVLLDRDDAGQFVALSQPRSFDETPEWHEGVIDSSLYQAAIDSGVPLGAMVELIRIFSFDVDFQRDIQPGDSFEVLYDGYFEETGQLAKTGPIRFARLTLSGKERRYYRYTATDGETDYFNDEGKSVRRALMRTPIDGARLSSGFGMRKHPILGYSKMHTGSDFAAPRGTPIYAAGNGKVVKAGRNGAYGNYVRIRHNSRYQTAYAHMNGIARSVKTGTRVEQGQIIGYVGSTGRVTGPHLHYEVHVDGKPVNPRSIDLPTGRELAGNELARFEALRLGMVEELAALRAAAPQLADSGEGGCTDDEMLTALTPANEKPVDIGAQVAC